MVNRPQGPNGLPERDDGRSPLLQVRVPDAIHAAIQARVANAGVTFPTYLRAVIEAHLDGRSELQFRESPVGLAAASDATRQMVAISGVKAKKRKATP